MELPPRARRILSYDSPRCLYIGTTSACAENTGRGGASSPQYQNYLRVRGEYKQVRSSGRWKMELPPRARRIPQRASSCQALRGTTSACAENTLADRKVAGWKRNYLRVRGEYGARNGELPERLELPPRARRIHKDPHRAGAWEGTTSACAENTFDGECEGGFDGNYLRVRGEYLRLRVADPHSVELPPRARRILCLAVWCRRALGTTSACAENTRFYAARTGCIRNYLRVRGEYKALIAPEQSPQELPPRARRIPTSPDGFHGLVGTTSACAENTWPRLL